MADGWDCPNCGRAHAPHVDTCPEQAAAPLYRLVYYTEPYDPLRPGYGTAPYRPTYPFTTC